MSSALVRRDTSGQVKRSFCTATIESDRTCLLSNYPKIEASVRRVLVAAVQNLPPPGRRIVVSLWLQCTLQPTMSMAGLLWTGLRQSRFRKFSEQLQPRSRELLRD